MENGFKSLLLAFGTTAMLQRETYFSEDCHQLMQEARKVFCKHRAVTAVTPVSNYVMKDAILWQVRKEPSWLGSSEWCSTFIDGEADSQTRTLQCLSEAYGGISEVGFRSFEVVDGDKDGDEDEGEGEDEDDDTASVRWVVVCPLCIRPGVALAVEVVGNSAGRRGVVVIDSPVEFLEWSSSPLRGAEGIEKQLPKIGEILKQSGIIAANEIVCSVEPLQSDDEILTKTLF